MVVGAGVFGLAAALELRNRGWAVTLLDPGPLPRPHASSTDRSKVVRMDYGRDEALSRLAQRAVEGWERWNVERFARPLFHRTGFLLLTLEPMAAGGFEMESFRSLAARGIPVERVKPDLLAKRFPAWNPARFVDGYLSHQAGWAESGEVVRAMLAWCRREGVSLLHRHVERVVHTGGRVRGAACAGGEMVTGDAVIVAAGAWTPGLVPELSHSLRPAAMPVLYFRPRHREPFLARRFPVWGADIPRTGWYGFPVGPDGIVKLGHHGKGWTGDPEDPGAVPSGWEERARDFLAESLPGLADAPLAGGRVCFYCDARDGDFWLTRHPAVQGLVVASGGSGHGFKFAPVLGELVANCVEGQDDPRLARFGWRPEAPPGAEHARYQGD